MIYTPRAVIQYAGEPNYANHPEWLKKEVSPNVIPPGEAIGIPTRGQYIPTYYASTLP
jgi:hypothetical protein